MYFFFFERESYEQKTRRRTQIPTIFQSRKWTLCVSSSVTSLAASKKSNTTTSTLMSAISNAKQVEMAILHARAEHESMGTITEKIENLITLASSQVNGLILVLLMNDHKYLTRLNANAETIQRVERGRSARTETKRYKTFKDFEKQALKARHDFEILVSDRQLDLSNKNENIKDSETKLDRADKSHGLAHTMTRELLSEYVESFARNHINTRV